MIDDKEIYRRFCEVLPGTVISAADSPFSDFEIYFESFSMAGLNEMHRYSVDNRLYEFFEFDSFVNIEDTKKYMNKLLTRMSGDFINKSGMYWFVRRKTDRRLVGTAGLLNLSYPRKSIEWGYGVDPDLWGMGYILEIQEILKHYVFEILQLNRLHGITMVENARTISSILAGGFKHEGTQRQYYCKNGIYHDGWQYGMLKQEYFESNNTHSKHNKSICYTINDIINLISSVLINEQINDESTMINTASWDSLNHMAIMVAIYEKTGINLSPIQIANATSVQTILKLLNGLSKL
jgi:RimJ/RimL family protein N-acetyltransferase/acyl carrier protein